MLLKIKDLNVEGNTSKFAISIIKKSKEDMNKYQDEEHKNIKSSFNSNQK